MSLGSGVTLGATARLRPWLKSTAWWASLAILVTLTITLSLGATAPAWGAVGAAANRVLAPGSGGFFIAPVYLFVLVGVVVLTPPTRRLEATAPLTRLLVVASVLVLILGAASFSSCVDPASAPLGALTATLTLFFGDGSTELFGAGSALCPGSPPLAYELARFLGVVTALSAALRVLSQYYRDTADRLGVRWARRIDVVVGDGPGLTNLTRALAHESKGRRHRVVNVVVTSTDDEVEALRRAQALVLRVDSGDIGGPLGIPGRRSTRKIRRLLIVGEDARANLALARAYLALRESKGLTAVLDYPVQVEISTAYDAALLRVQFLANGPAEIDPFAREELAAREVAALMLDRAHRIILSGSPEDAAPVLREAYATWWQAGGRYPTSFVFLGSQESAIRDQLAAALPAFRRSVPYLTPDTVPPSNVRHRTVPPIVLTPSVALLESQQPPGNAPVRALNAHDLMVIFSDVSADVRGSQIREAQAVGAMVLQLTPKARALRTGDHIGASRDGVPWEVSGVISYGMDLTEHGGPPTAFVARILHVVRADPQGGQDVGARSKAEAVLLGRLLAHVRKSATWTWVAAGADDAPFYLPVWGLEALLDVKTAGLTAADARSLLNRLHMAGISLRPVGKDAASVWRYRGEKSVEGSAILSRHPVEGIEPGWRDAPSGRYLSHDVVLVEQVGKGVAVRTSAGVHTATRDSRCVTHPTGEVELLESSYVNSKFGKS